MFNQTIFSNESYDNNNSILTFKENIHSQVFLDCFSNHDDDYYKKFSEDYLNCNILNNENIGENSQNNSDYKNNSSPEINSLSEELSNGNNIFEHNSKEDSDRLIDLYDANTGDRTGKRQLHLIKNKILKK